MGRAARWIAALAALLALSVPGGGAGRSAAATSPRGVPILLYHHVSAAPRKAKSPSLYVPAGLFGRQMAALADAGYTGVTMAQVVAAWDGGTALPAKPVVVSFDDGYTDQSTAARPVLAAHGWPGVLYLVANSTLPQRLSAAQVRGLLDDGWELGAHSLTHADLTKVSAAKLTREVSGSRSALAARYDTSVGTFAYPYGHLNSKVERAVRVAGFQSATTTQSGFARPSQDHDRLPRLIVTPRTTPAALVAQLASAG